MGSILGNYLGNLAIFCSIYLVTLVHSYLSGMFIVDDLEHEREQGDEDLVAVLQIEAHVERLHVSEILEKVKVPGSKFEVGLY